MIMAGSENLVLKRTFNAPVERVFEAWTNADALARWFGPEGFDVAHAELDLVEGGHYDIEIRSAEGHQIRHFGSYVEILPPHRLVFTWILGEQDCKGEPAECADTLVTVELQPQGAATELTLTHERLPNKAARDGHEFGWSSSLDSLNNYFS